MSKLSTEQVAELLGISKSALSRYILAGKVAAPPETMAGGIRMRLWSETEIARLRNSLPRIANGRKTRYKKQSATGAQHSAKTKLKMRKPKKK